MTYERLAEVLIERWNMSRRISAMGKAIVLSSKEIEMLVVACHGADALRSLSLQEQQP